MATVKDVVFRLVPKTKQAREALKKMSASAKAFSSEVKKAEKSTGALGGSIGKVGKLVAGAFAVQKIIAFTKASIAALDQQEKAQQKLLVALKDNEDAQRRLIEQAQELQKVTIFGDEAIINAQAFLATMGLNEDAIKRLTPLILDLATKQDIDLASAADLVAKSVGSSTNALKRYGIDIKGAVGSSERLESAIEALNEQVGGQAEAAAQAGSGALQQISNRIGDLQEKFGALVLKGIAPFLDNIGDAITFADNFGTTLRLLGREINSAFGILEKGAISNADALAIYNNGITESGKAIKEVIPDFMTLKREQLVSLKLTEERVQALVAEGESLEDARELVRALSNERLTELMVKKEANEEGKKTVELTEEEIAARKKLLEQFQKDNKAFREQVFKDVQDAEDRIDDLLTSMIDDDLLRQQTALELKAEREKRAIDQSVDLELAGEGQKAELKRLIDANLQKDIEKLNAEAYRADKKLKDQAAKEAEDRADDELELKKQRNKQALDDTINTLSMASSILEQEVAREISLQERRVEQARDIADEGNAEILEQEQRKLDELNRQREAFVRQQQILAAIQFAADTAVAVAKTAAESGILSPAFIATTLAAIIGGVAQASAIFNPQGFAEGTEYVNGKGSTTSDDIPAMLSRGERVVDAKTNKNYFKTLSAIHNGSVAAEDINSFVDNYGKFNRDLSDILLYDNSGNLSSLEDRLESIEKAIRGKGNASVNINERGIYAIVDRITYKQDRLNRSF